MINSKDPKNKNNSGFSLIEALVALFIIGLFVGALFKFQGNIFRSTIIGHNILERVNLFRNTFTKAQIEEWYKKKDKQEIKDEGPNTTINYKIEKINSNSSLSKIKNLYIETVDANWKQFMGTTGYTFVNFRFNI